MLVISESHQSLKNVIFVNYIC